MEHVVYIHHHLWGAPDRFQISPFDRMAEDVLTDYDVVKYLVGDIFNFCRHSICSGTKTMLTVVERRG